MSAVEGRSKWACTTSDECIDRVACVGVGAALAAIAGVATYFCIVNGFPMLDTAYSSLDQFTAGFLLYSGATFSIVAAVNVGYTGFKFLCHQGGSFYGPEEAGYQVVLSALAPLVVAVALPALLIMGMGMAAK